MVQSGGVCLDTVRVLHVQRRVLVLVCDRVLAVFSSWLSVAAEDTLHSRVKVVAGFAHVGQCEQGKGAILRERLEDVDREKRGVVLSETWLDVLCISRVDLTIRAVKWQ